jgi:hypothetical protein
MFSYILLYLAKLFTILGKLLQSRYIKCSYLVLILCSPRWSSSVLVPSTLGWHQLGLIGVGSSIDCFRSRAGGAADHIVDWEFRVTREGVWTPHGDWTSHGDLARDCFEVKLGHTVCSVVKGGHLAVPIWPILFSRNLKTTRTDIFLGHNETHARRWTKRIRLRVSITLLAIGDR